ncbi:MAG TPA: methyltransferase domain-containing protein [Longimicrobium sp.]|nr:methyltransferase domain-containing protein [Longimicrobium sp.]
MDPRALDRQYASSTNLAARIELHRRCSTNPYGLQRWVFDCLELAPGVRVLEVGCGTGSLWRDNLDRLPAGVELVLTDRAPGMLAAAGAAVGERPARFVACALPDLPFSDGAFDLVVADHMLYHVEDRQRGLLAIRRVLRRGGALFATTNGAGHLGEIKDLLRELAIDAPNVSAAFTLENGEAQLRRVFPAVRRDVYADALEVRDPELLLAYIASLGGGGAAAVAARRDAILAAIASRMRGAVFHVGKSTGAFTVRAE